MYWKHAIRNIWNKIRESYSAPVATPSTKKQHTKEIWNVIPLICISFSFWSRNRHMFTPTYIDYVHLLLLCKYYHSFSVIFMWFTFDGLCQRIFTARDWGRARQRTKKASVVLRFVACHWKPAAARGENNECRNSCAISRGKYYAGSQPRMDK